MAGLKTKIAKVGLLIGLLEKIPVQMGVEGWTDQCKTVLLVVLTVVIAVFIVQFLRRKGCGEILQPENQCRIISEGSCLRKLDVKKENQNKSQEEMKKKETRWARENEPASNGAREYEPAREGTSGSRENEPDSLRLKKEKKDWNVCRPAVTESVCVAGGKTPKLRDDVRDGFGNVEENPEGRRKQCGKAVVGLVETSDDTQDRREFLTLESSLNHCPTGCPGLSVRVGRAMDDDKVYRLAALKVGTSEKSGRSLGGLVDEPWNQAMFMRSPGHGQDQWIETMRSEGWLVRSHSKWRSKTFHPLHRTLPIDPQEFTGVRVSISFDADEKRMVLHDEWLQPTKDLFVPKKQWKGWTLLQLRRPSPNHYGESVRTAMGEDESKSEKYTKEGDSTVPLKGPKEEMASSSMGRVQGSGYAMGSTTEKGVFVANQLPVPPTQMKEVEKDEDGSEWAWVTDFERVG